MTTIRIDDEDVTLKEARKRLGVPNGECLGCFLGDASPDTHDIPDACEDGGFLYEVPADVHGERAKAYATKYVNESSAYPSDANIASACGGAVRRPRPDEYEAIRRAVLDLYAERLTPAARVEAKILECFADDYEPDPHAVAEVLVDEDVSRGEYEGCSSDLEMAFTEYEHEAERQLGGKAVV